jgi:hypothetical protein
MSRAAFMVNLLMSAFEENKTLAAEALDPSGYSRALARCGEWPRSSQRARTDA